MAIAIPFVSAAGYGIGYGLDSVLGTTWLRVVFLLLGVIGSLAQIVFLALRDSKNK